MKYKKMMPVLALLVCIQLAAGALAVSGMQSGALDMVKVNELTYRCIEAWPQLEAGQTQSLPQSSYDYAVLSANGRLLYAQNGDGALTLQQAIRNRDTLVDLSAEGRALGKLVLRNDYAAQSGQLVQRLFLLLFFETAVFIAFWVFFAYRLNKTVFRPFAQLKSFAARVAGGNLDIPLPMDRGNAFGAFTESFDLMRDELMRAREMERRAGQSKKELVAKLSHDIKTPIASIKAVAEVMALSAQSEKEKQQLGVIEAKADQVDSLISNLFHATLEELQELAVDPAQHSSGMLRDLIRQADYLKKAEVGEIPDCLVWFDPLRLQQVFDNLIGNSYKYANTSIRVTAELAQERLVVRLCDYGPGVPPDELPLLFGKFYRGGNAQGKSGSGLGLYIAHYLLAQMNGAITCENTGSGFCVRVSLQI